jgi:cation diffusion facilitator family transporter
VPFSDLGRTEAYQRARRATRQGIGVNLALSAIKGTAGVLGGSYALVADAIESGLDVVTSALLYLGLRVASAPPTVRHPYGKGRAETISALFVGLVVMVAAVLIGVESVRGIQTPHRVPEAWTLAVLVGVIVFKEGLYRRFKRTSDELGSVALGNEAWHHRSDALTSLAAAVGISVALVGGPAYASADDWAALVAAGVILVNGIALMRAPFSLLLDARPEPLVEEAIRSSAMSVEGVRDTHHCRIRKHGFDYFVDLDIRVDGGLTVLEGHEIAHRVQDAVRSRMPLVNRVLVHVEPSLE